MSGTKSPVHLTLSTTTSATGAIVASWRVENRGPNTIYVFASRRMPYVLAPSKHSLVILYGVNAPDPNIDYNVIEIPPTKELASKATLEGTVALTPLILRDHFSSGRTETKLSGEVSVVFQLGWGATPIQKDDAHITNINALLKWQTLVSSEPIKVRLP